MKGFISDTRSGESINLELNDIITCHTRQAAVTCKKGVIWITWPDGNEVILRQGESIHLRSKGKICVVALSMAQLSMNKSPFKKVVLTPFRFEKPAPRAGSI